MKRYGKAVLILLLAAVSMTTLAFSTDDVEYRPAEKAMENLFNKGIGDPWVGGDPFASDMYTSDMPMKDYGKNKQTHPAQQPLTNCQLMGFLNVQSGLIIASDEGNSLKLHPGPGNYPVYACFDNGKLIGLFIDFNYIGS